MEIPLKKSFVDFGPDKFSFFRLDGDETYCGAVAGLQKNVFNFQEISFNNGDVFLDLGCNVGILSLFIAKAWPNSRVFAFDASKLCIDILRLSIIENKITNLWPFHLAVGGITEAIKLSFDAGHPTCLEQVGFNERDIRVEVPYLVKKIKIDEIFDSNLLSLGDVKYLKCDIEGGEYELFQHLIDNRPDILDRIEFMNLEMHPYEKLKEQDLVIRQKLTDRFRNRLVIQN